MLLNVSLDFLLLKSVFFKVMDLSKYIFKGRRTSLLNECKCTVGNKTKLLCDFITYIKLVQSTGYSPVPLDVCLPYGFFSI